MIEGAKYFAGFATIDRLRPPVIGSTMTDTVKLLQVVPIFSDLSVDSLRELADSCRQLTFKRLSPDR